MWTGIIKVIIGLSMIAVYTYHWAGVEGLITLLCIAGVGLAYAGAIELITYKQRKNNL